MLNPVQYATDFFKLPRPALQKEWVGEWEKVTTHTQGKYPKKFVDTRRPYEDPAIRKYRVDNWEPITKDPFGRALNNLQRIFSGSSVTVTMPEELEAYTERRIFKKNDFDTYMNRFVLRRMIEDPNGVLVWWPEVIPNANEPLSPQPYLVLSKQVYHDEPDLFCWKSPEKSPILVTKPSGRKEIANVGDVYYIVDDVAYWKYVQVGEAKDKEFELRPHYTHNLGYLPTIVLGGEETTETNKKTGEEDLWFTTYFASAIPYANEALRQFTDHQGIMVTCGFPLREMDPVKCSYKGCNGTGVIKVPLRKTIKGDIPNTLDGTNLHVRYREDECPGCHGTGKMLPASPYGVVYRAEKNMMEDGKTTPVDVVKFLSPPVDILKYSGEHWRGLVKDTSTALNLIFTDEAQSGEAKKVDREGQVSQLDRIGQHFYNNLYLGSLIINAGLLGLADAEEECSVALPPTFVASTGEDLLEEMKALREGGHNSMISGRAQVEFMLKRFSGDPRVHRQAEILFWYDPLFGYSQDEKQLLEASGAVTIEELRKSLYAPSVLQWLVMEDEAILEDEPQAIRDALDDAIEEMAPEPPAPEPVDPLTGQPPKAPAKGAKQPPAKQPPPPAQ